LDHWRHEALINGQWNGTYRHSGKMTDSGEKVQLLRAIIAKLME
jgi:hypothetical protein